MAVHIDRDRQTCDVAREKFDVHGKSRHRAAESLRADAGRVDFFRGSPLRVRRSADRDSDRRSCAAALFSRGTRPFQMFRRCPCRPRSGDRGCRPPCAAFRPRNRPRPAARRRVQHADRGHVFRAAALGRERDVEFFPGTSSRWITGGVLSCVFFRSKSGSFTIDLRR